MVVESARICGRVGFVLGVTSYLGRAWLGSGAAWVLLHGCILKSDDAKPLHHSDALVVIISSFLSKL